MCGARACCSVSSSSKTRRRWRPRQIGPVRWPRRCANGGYCSVRPGRPETCSRSAPRLSSSANTPTFSCKPSTMSSPLPGTEPGTVCHCWRSFHLVEDLPYQVHRSVRVQEGEPSDGLALPHRWRDEGDLVVEQAVGPPRILPGGPAAAAEENDAEF